MTLLVAPGESTFHLPLKTVRIEKGDVAKRFGIWSGIVTRIQEVIVGIEHGVVKGRTVASLPHEANWAAKQVTQMRGVPWEQVPGKIDRRIPAAIDHSGDGVQAHDDDESHAQPGGIDEEEPTIQFRGGPDKFHVSRKAIEGYGPTERCPACSSITRRGTTPGRVGTNHNDKCRARVTAAMRNDPHHRHLESTPRERNVSMG